MSESEENPQQPQQGYNDQTDVAVDYDDSNVEGTYDAVESDRHPDDLKNDDKNGDDKQDHIFLNVLFVSRFARGTTIKDIEDMMKPFGVTTEIAIRDNIAFVDFATPDEAAKAKEACHRHPGLGSDSLIVDFKKDRGAPRVSDSSLFP